MDGWDDYEGGSDINEVSEMPEPVEDVSLDTMDVSDVMDSAEPIETLDDFETEPLEVETESTVDSVMDSVDMDIPEFDDEPQIEDIPEFDDESQIEDIPELNDESQIEDIPEFNDEPQLDEIPEDVPEEYSVEMLQEEAPEMPQETTEALEEIPEQIADPQTISEELTQQEALNNMSEYMNSHNYGLSDYATYSQDPEWQALNRDLQIADGIEVDEPVENIAEQVPEVEDAQDIIDEVPDEIPEETIEEAIEEAPEEVVEEVPEEIVEEVPEEVVEEVAQETVDEIPEADEVEVFQEVPPESPEESLEIPDDVPEQIEESETLDEVISQQEALNNMSEYMNIHNYGLDDYETYSQDPEWQALNRDLQIADGIEVTEPIENIADEASELEPRVFDEFEQSVLEEKPEFYETGQFYEQGINEFGYQGTCGPTSQANAINELFGTTDMTENKILSIAIDNNLCNRIGNPEDLGGTSTDQFMELYSKVNEELGDKFDTELYEFENVLDANQVAERLEAGDVVNVAVDACALWNQPRNYVDDMGVRQDDFASDHWITVTGVNRSDTGEINGFDIIDSGGGENYVSLDKYNEICFGTPEHKVLDPTCIVLSKKV